MEKLHNLTLLQEELFDAKETHTALLKINQLSEFMIFHKVKSKYIILKHNGIKSIMMYDQFFPNFAISAYRAIHNQLTDKKVTVIDENYTLKISDDELKITIGSSDVLLQCNLDECKKILQFSYSFITPFIFKYEHFKTTLNFHMILNQTKQFLNKDNKPINVTDISSKIENVLCHLIDDKKLPLQDDGLRKIYNLYLPLRHCIENPDILLIMILYLIFEHVKTEQSETFKTRLREIRQTYKLI